MTEDLQKLDERRKECNYLAGELLDLAVWLDSGYKDGQARGIVVDFVHEKVNELKSESSAILDLIMLRRRESEKVEKLETKIGKT